MPEFLTLLPPDAARQKLFAALTHRNGDTVIETAAALGRVTAEDVFAPHPLPAFSRSTVDGYAVHARDTFGASESLPGYLRQIGEVPMGAAPEFSLTAGQCALIHTGGMLPSGADAVVMLENTQTAGEEIEVLRSVAPGENTLNIGEDVATGNLILKRGTRLRPAEIGGLLALGIINIRVAIILTCGIISTGNEIISPNKTPQPGQVRDINSYTLASLIIRAGGQPVFYGIIPDQQEALTVAAKKALAECDLVIITAGSSASTRDMTADVIDAMGEPGVLVHGINTRPGKPTILGACRGKALIGLPGNPVSALVNGGLFVVPVIEKLLGLPDGQPVASVKARLTVNLASQTGREDWWPVRLVRDESGWLAEPIFGKSNLIFTLVAASGLIRIEPDANGLSAGEIVEVIPL